MPTRPFDFGSPAAHSTVSYPSSASCANGYHSPSLLHRPRTSWTATMYPRRAYHSGCV